jgi:hypothetical protein
MRRQLPTRRLFATCARRARILRCGLLRAHRVRDSLGRALICLRQLRTASSAKTPKRRNPFFIRSVQTRRASSVPRLRSRNPFFIRAFVHACSVPLLAPIQVVIPSSSGHSFMPWPPTTLAFAIIWETGCQILCARWDRGASGGARVMTLLLRFLSFPCCVRFPC